MKINIGSISVEVESISLNSRNEGEYDVNMPNGEIASLTVTKEGWHKLETSTFVLEGKNGSIS